MPDFNRLALERLMRCYRLLSDSELADSGVSVTSAQIADALDIDPSQVRKDFAAIGLVGLGRVGFDVCEVCRAIRNALGFDRQYKAVLVGAGHLGGALLAYAGFSRYGLNIVAVFDRNESAVGSTIAGHVIKSTKTMTSYVRRNQIRLAILTTPASATQSLADRLIRAGVTAIWNFAPTELTVPDDVLVRNEHISRGLSEIAYHLKD